jgi:Holliday junction resolvasome RuvABC endonuclease subunit
MGKANFQAKCTLRTYILFVYDCGVKLNIDWFTFARWGYCLHTTIRIPGKLSDNRIKRVQQCLAKLESITPNVFSIEQSRILRRLEAVLERREIHTDEEFQIKKRAKNLSKKFHKVLERYSLANYVEPALFKEQVRYKYTYI